MTTTTTRDAVEYIAGMHPFTTHGELSGFPGFPSTFGSLPEQWADRLNADRASIAYVVMSYRTPIAWVTTDGRATVPGVRYSVTTSRHQGVARRGLGVEFAQLVQA